MKSLENKLMMSYSLLMQNVCRSKKELLEYFENLDNMVEYDNIIEAANKDNKLFYKSFNYMKKGLKFFEKLMQVLESISIDKAPHEMIVYALKHFSLESRPNDEKSTKDILNKIDTEILPQAGINYSNLALESLFLTNLGFISNEYRHFLFFYLYRYQ